MHLLDEVAQHLLAHLEVGNDAVFEGPNGLNMIRRAANHALGFETNSDGSTVVGVNRDDRRLVKHNPLATHINQCVRRTEVDRKITPQAEWIVTGHDLAFPSQAVVRVLSGTGDPASKVGTPDSSPREYQGDECYRFGKKIAISR